MYLFQFSVFTNRNIFGVYSLDKTLRLLSLAIKRMETHWCVFNQSGFHRSCTLRAVFDTRTAGNAFFYINQTGIFRINSTYRTHLCTDSALWTLITDCYKINSPQFCNSSIRISTRHMSFQKTIMRFVKNILGDWMS